jgi:hypothetical protein
MEERLLLKSSENISKLLNLISTHEYNVKNYIRNSRNFDIQLIFDRISLDINQNIRNQTEDENEEFNLDISQNVHQPQTHVQEQLIYTTFGALENTNEMICPITQETFNSQDNIVLLDCGHYFKKDGFMVWARRSRSCPSCRAYFR